MKTKLFKLVGSNTEKLGMSNSPYSLMDSNNLSTYVDVITIGDLEVGFKIKDLKTHFAAHLSDDLESLNILLCIHSENKIDKYFLETQNGVEVECSKIINALVIATDGRPLKILSLGCYGANFHNYLKFLPPKSLLITLSDKDKETSSCDYHTLNAQVLLNVFFKDGFSIERLLEAYLFNQKYTFNTPIISMIYDGSYETLSMKNVIREIFKSGFRAKDSTFIEALKNSQILTEEQVNIAKKELLLHTVDAAHLIPRGNVLSMITESWKNGDMSSFLMSHEDKYYFPGSLKNLKLTLEDFNEDFTPVAMTNFAQVNLSKYLQLEYYITKHNLAENPLVQEERELFFSDNLSEPQLLRFTELQNEEINKLMSNYRGLEMILSTKSANSLLVFADENFKIHNERSGSDGESIFDYTLMVNSVVPQYSICMGIAFDIWLQDHL
jgi:hypothetical protein